MSEFKSFVHKKIYNQLQSFNLSHIVVDKIYSFFENSYQEGNLPSSFLADIEVKYSNINGFYEISIAARDQSWEFDTEGSLLTINGLTYQETLYQNSFSDV